MTCPLSRSGGVVRDPLATGGGACGGSATATTGATTEGAGTRDPGGGVGSLASTGAAAVLSTIGAGTDGEIATGINDGAPASGEDTVDSAATGGGSNV